MPSSLMAVALFSVVPLVAATGSAIPTTTTTDPTARSLEDLNSNSNLHWQHRRGNSELVPVDQSLLAAQVGGLVAAYVVFVAILLSLLFFVGRRLRRTVHSSNYSLQVEMMKPIHPPPLSSVEPSPISPVSAHLPGVDRGNGFSRSLTSLTRDPKSHRMSSNGSAGGSAASIDESVVASDRRRAQEQMELLYAAVMEQDEQKEAGVLGMDHDNSSSSGSGGGSHHQHYNSVQSPHSSTISNPFTDRSSRVLDEPSERPQQEPEPPPQPQQQQPPTSPRSTNSRLSKRISSLSLFSSNHRTSNTGPSTTSKILSPRLPKKLSISSPLASPDVTASSSYGDEQPPLTPRLYNPTAPPAPPIRVSPAPPPPAKSSGMGRAPAPAPLSLSSSSHLASSSSNGPSQGGSLPFRDAFPPQSAPATKTTILERPTKQLNGPRTGMPTPYSPYMPFTPVTPLTPSRMVTRRERKRGGRENGLRVLNEDEDLVKDDKDMWGY